MKKTIVLSLAVGLLLFAGFARTKAQTVEELQAQIQALLQQVNALQAQGNAALPAQTNAQGQPFLVPTNPNIGIVPTEPSPIFASVLQKTPQACNLPQAVAIGLKGDSVSVLQRYLSLDEKVYPEGYVTGYYGPLTEVAFKRFQQKYNFPVSGVLDDATKAKLNERIAVNQRAIPECGLVLAPTLEAAKTFTGVKEDTTSLETKGFPFITSMSPSVAPPGTSVTITGGNFKPIKNDVTFGSIVIKDVPAIDKDLTKLSFQVPSAAVGLYPVSVTNVNGTSNIGTFALTTSDGATIVKEQVKCVFNNTTAEQRCYTAVESGSPLTFGCSGIGTCVTDVSGPQGTKLTWKSSCGGYAYTTIDGNNEYAEFQCGVTTAPVITVLSPNGGEIYQTGTSITVRWNQIYSASSLVIRLFGSNGLMYYSGPATG